jgi:hypothetical protein
VTSAFAFGAVVAGLIFRRGPLVSQAQAGGQEAGVPEQARPSPSVRP